MRDDATGVAVTTRRVSIPVVSSHSGLAPLRSRSSCKVCVTSPPSVGRSAMVAPAGQKAETLFAVLVRVRLRRPTLTTKRD